MKNFTQKFIGLLALVFAMSFNANSQDLPVEGCIDEYALNYNPDASIDDGSCEYFTGCMNENAANYDPSATQDNGSCIYALSLQGIIDFTVPSGGSNGKAIHLVANQDIADLSVFGLGVANNGGGTDGLEYSLDAVSASSGDDILIVRSVEAMSAYFEDCYSEFEIIMVANSDISQNGDDAIELFQQGEGIIEVFGNANVDGTGQEWEYLDSWAYKVGDLWFYGGVNCTDGSQTSATSDCPYPICSDTPIEIINGCTDVVALNYNPNATVDNGACEYLTGCMDPIAINYNPDAVMGDDSCEYLSGCMDPSAINYNPEAGMGDDSCEYLSGCMDPNAINYNPDASMGDGSCEYSAGCMDPSAINFNPDAFMGDDSCEYDNEPGCPFDLTLISTFSGEWDDEISLSITSSTNELVFALSQGYPNYEGYGVIEIIEGVSTYNAGDFNVCLNPQECYTIRMTDYYGDGWNGAYFTLNEETFSLPSGSEISYNYGLACEEEICTDSLYSYELSQNSNFGVSVIDFNSGQTLYSVAGGSTGEFCLNSEGCYIFQLSNATGVIDSSNVDYLIFGDQEYYFDQGEVVGGGAYSVFNPFLTTFSDVLETGCITSGCTDSLSDNFDIMAVVNDGSCQLYEVGCMDSLAFNYNDQALLDDGSCEPIIEGCTDASALNYNEFVNTDDGSCIPAVYGCTDPSMSNFSPEANTYDYSCISWEEYASGLQAQLDSIVPEECEEVATQNIPLDLPQGWSMFGYTCLESLDVVEAFSDISDNIEIVKDEWGLAYLPAWGFSAFDNLEFGEGYQIKMLEGVTGFQFCTTIAGGASQEELDAAYLEGAASVTPEDGIDQSDVDSASQDGYSLGFADGAASVTPEDGITQEVLDAAIEEVHAMYEGWCESDIDNDGICDVDEVSGCMDASSCNYVSEAEFDDGSCDYVSCLDECGIINGDNSSCTDECGVPNGDNSSCTDECGVVNGDNSSCTDCAGVVNGTSEDLGCGCGNPAAEAGYDCEGNFTGYEVGDFAHGGIVFYVDETGEHGLVAAIEDLTEGAADQLPNGEAGYEWGCYSQVVNGADEQAIGTGYQNTMDIVNQGCLPEYGGGETITAAQAALDAEINGYSDWYLPSKDELIQMYYTIGEEGAEDNIGGFETSYLPNYWSSSEFEGPTHAWAVRFENGISWPINKLSIYRVRVIRGF